MGLTRAGMKPLANNFGSLDDHAADHRVWGRASKGLASQLQTAPHHGPIKIGSGRGIGDRKLRHRTGDGGKGDRDRTRDSFPNGKAQMIKAKAPDPAKSQGRSPEPPLILTSRDQQLSGHSAPITQAGDRPDVFGFAHLDN
jgi:hypothetical protein